MEPNMFIGNHYEIIDGVLKIIGRSFRWRIPLGFEQIHRGDVVLVRTYKGESKVIVKKLTYDKNARRHKEVLKILNEL